VTERSYARPPGGLPPQDEKLTGRAVFTEAYAVLPRDTMRDIVTSSLPGWRRTRAWILARPLSGFAETFAQYAVEVAPGGGGGAATEPDPRAEAGIFVTHGSLSLNHGGASCALAPGSYAYLPPGTDWSLANNGAATAVFHWIRKVWAPVAGLEAPPAFVTNERDHPPVPMPDTDGRWSTTRFVDPDDLRHDMHVNIVTLMPGATIPFEETHVMEHGLYILEGRGVYKLNRDWVEVEAGDFLWLRAFCPQACVASGTRPFRYLLYKDVNRHPPLGMPGT